MRISVLDPGLIARGGHHLEWNLRVTDELISLGHEVDVYANARVGPLVVDAFAGRAPLSPLFGSSPYHVRLAMHQAGGELSAFLEDASALANDLSRIGERDLWLWPSLFAQQLYACAQVAPAARVSGCIHVAPDVRPLNSRMAWRQAFGLAQHAKLRANIGVTGPLLQREFAPLTGSGAIDRFPVAHDGSPTGLRKTAPDRIGFFGHQRNVKGASLLPELVARLRADGFHIVLHDSGNVVQASNAPGLTVLGYLPNLAEEIAKCDVVVLPYDPAVYRVMESGIVWDAIASGVPVVLPANTAPCLLVEATGAGVTIPELSVDAICRAMVDVRQNYARISNAAFEASQRWKATQGVKKFVAAMLRDASAMP